MTSKVTNAEEKTEKGCIKYPALEVVKVLPILLSNPFWHPELSRIVLMCYERAELLCIQEGMVQ